MSAKKPKKPPQFNYLMPPEECERIYKVLEGPPGLDPCGHPDQFLDAGQIMYGTADEDDGFKVSWRDYNSVVLNAPHGEREPDWDAIAADNPDWTRPDHPWHPFSRWITKASIEAAAGATVLAFMPAATDRKWFHQYVVAANAVALLEQRVKCYLPSNKADHPPVRGPQPMNAHMLVLWTKDSALADRFYEVYKERGMIVEPVAVKA